MAAVISRGRGRGRGMNKGWLGNFKPKPCNVKPEDIIRDQYTNAEEEDLVSLIHDDNLNASAVDKLSEQIAEDILGDSSNTGIVEYLSEKIAEDMLLSSSSKNNNNNKQKIQTISQPELDEKPAHVPADEKSWTGIQVIPSDEKLSPNVDEQKSSQFDPTLINAVHAQEFIPRYPSEDQERKLSITSVTSPPQEGRPPLLRTPSTGEEQVALDVLKDVMMTLIENPGDFDSVVDQLTEHLTHFVTKEETLKEMVSVLIEQSLKDPSVSYIVARLSHHFDESKCLELANGITFRKVFFKRCQQEFINVKKLLNNLEVKENITLISNTALLFGELCCNMKLKEQTNPIYKKVVFNFVDMFLEAATKEFLITLTRLLKLVGPDLDIDRPKDVEDVFNKIRDFYLDTKKTEHLSQSIKNSIWHVYKLHSRDWDRRESAPPSPAITEDKSFALPVATKNALAEQTQRKNSRESPTKSSPVDWNEYYVGDDVDIYQNYMEPTDTDDEGFDAYEEFLKMSGQV